MSDHTESAAAGVTQGAAARPLTAQYASAVHSRTSELVATVTQVTAGRPGMNHDLLARLDALLAESQGEADAAQGYATTTRDSAPDSEAATTAREREAAAAVRVLDINNEVQRFVIEGLAAAAGDGAEGRLGGRLGGLEALTDAVSRVGQRRAPALDENQQRINAEMAGRRRRTGDPGRQPDADKQQQVIELVDRLIARL